MKQRLQAMFVLLIFLVSLQPFFCYAGDFYVNDSWSKPDSDVDKSLFFVPLPPDVDSKDYMIFRADPDNTIYFYSSDRWIEDAYDIYGTTSKRIVTDYPFVLYKYNTELSRWDYVGRGTSRYDYWNFTFKNFVVIDATCNVFTHTDETYYYEYQGHIQKNGYRIYWTMTLILNQILDYVDYAAQLILSNDVLKYSVLSVFAGELLFCAVKLIQRIGAIGYAQKSKK